MLFGSYPFLLLFLPVFLATFRVSRFPKRLYVLLLFSLLFYMSWSIPFLALMLAVITTTWGMGNLLAWRPASPPDPHALVWRGVTRRQTLALALIITLLPLLWFKYSFFLVSNLSLLLNEPLTFTPPALPPGISFYTFIQIAWLVGVYRSLFQPPRLKDHALFSCFFPYVLAGPIVRFPQLAPQFEGLGSLSATLVAPGLTLFLIGLGKKILLADALAPYADAVFNAAQNNWLVLPLDAWLASLSYTFQLYFDFSGYTDMALGVALMVGIKLPENFNSPYRSTGIIEFWRRWHITLGAWLKDFIYIPLGGNRKGKMRHYLNLFLTMSVGGLWHGAGWTYVLWGAMHGFMLAVNHFYRTCAAPNKPNAPSWRICSILLTFLLLNLTWVIFRAPSLDCALAMYKAMFSLSDSALATIHFGTMIPWVLLALCAIICWGLPNSHAILQGQARFLKWRPSKGWACVMGILCAFSLLFISRQTNFLYFQF